jgi:membrane peptidoglycan carboxypeptidase
MNPYTDDDGRFEPGTHDTRGYDPGGYDRPVSGRVPVTPPPTGRASVGRASVSPSGPYGSAEPQLGDGYSTDSYEGYGATRYGDRGLYGDGPGGEDPRPGDNRSPSRRRPPARDPKKATTARRRNILIAAFAVFIMLTGGGMAAATFYVDGTPTPDELTLPEATTVYYADGKTVMARLGQENRTIIDEKNMNDAIKNAIVAAEDQTFWTNQGVDFKGVLRALWNNVTGGPTQGASTLTQQYARTAMDLKGVTYSRKLREAVIAWKMGDKYSKEEILGFYLNTVPFGRGTHGAEAAAQAYFHKTINKNAPPEQQLTVSEAMLLVSFVKQPEPDPSDPTGHPGYDPTINAVAKENAVGRWNYVRGSEVSLKYLKQADADAMTFPTTVVKYDSKSQASNMELPTGLVVQHALSELRQTPQFKGREKGYIENGGFQIVTTVDKRAEDAAIQAADLTNPKAPAIDRNQPAEWQAALVSIEPGTGRVLAYFGGKDGTGPDFAGYYYDADGVPTGYGKHPPGSTFKVYDLVTALKKGYSLQSYWDSPPVSKEFPQADRVKGKLGPIHNAGPTTCTPICTLSQAAVNSLNVPMFDLTLNIGAANVLETARDAGIDDMWDANGKRIDLRNANITGSRDIVPGEFSPELGIGQFAVTVVDHANGMATMAASGKRAEAHFVKAVSQHGQQVYGEKLGITKDLGLTPQQIGDLDDTLRKVSTSIPKAGWVLPNTWNVASKTGTWEWKPTDADKNAHVWVTGYTKAIATAVWLGTTTGTYLKPKTGSASNVFGNNYVGPIWQQFMTNATAAMFPHPAASLLHFEPLANVGNLDPVGSVPSPTPAPPPPPPPPTDNPTPTPISTPPPLSPTVPSSGGPPLGGPPAKPTP